MSGELFIEWELAELPPEEERERFEAIWRQALDAVCREESVEVPVEAELNVVDEEEIHELNREHRDIDRSTDVLSFPLLDLVPGEYGTLADEETNPENGCVSLGNIVLSWAHVARQAAEYGHSREREAAFLVTHSLLHLLGYDHMEEAEETLMRSKQKLVLEAMGLPRGEEAPRGEE